MTLSSTVKPSSGLTYTWTYPASAPCSGTPTASTVTPALQSCCIGSNPGELTATGQTPFWAVFNYQWEVSTDGGTTWANAPGGIYATRLVYTPSFNGVAIQYRLATSCPATGQTVYSSVAQIIPAAA
ncbi:MAG: hypothetical protein ACKO7X_01065, partial [Bacteroidota bacterium]